MATLASSPCSRLTRCAGRLEERTAATAIVICSRSLCRSRSKAALRSAARRSPSHTASYCSCREDG